MLTNLLHFATRTTYAALCCGLILISSGVACDSDDTGESEKPTRASKPDSDDDSDSADSDSERYVLGSVTINADGERVSYAQIIDNLAGPFTNADGIEASGNAVFLAHGRNFFYGLAESPEWVRYSTRDGFKETGRLSFSNFGITYMDFANVIVDDDTAVSVLTEAYVAVVWNPTTMQIKGTIDLGDMERKGFTLEAFTTSAHEGLVYMPGTWVNWEAPDVMQTVSMTVLDPKAMKVVSMAEDDRCGAGGRVIFDDKGYAYVMGNGRNQSMQAFAESKKQPVVPNCLLRIAPGGTDFEEDFFFTIPELTGGLDAMTELEPGDIDSGIGFAMMYYEDKLEGEPDIVNFEHWQQRIYKMWRIVLGDEPKAEEVKGAEFSVVGFSGSSIGNKLYSGASPDGTETTVVEYDPDANTATPKFEMKGYFSGLMPLQR